MDRLLAEHPPAAQVLVITGTAGVGKTSLALHWAHAVRRHFPDGQLYANLHGYDPQAPVAPAQVLERFLRALDVPAAAIPADPDAMASTYRSLVAGRRTLIVLDNASSAAQVRPLLPGAPGCLVVVTSRHRLSGLSVREGARHLTVEVLAEHDAVELLRAVTADYRSGDDPEELVQLARLCARLPLALRIAAERAVGRPWMLLDHLIQDLRDESSLWDALSSEDEEESEAVRSVFAWSYRALPADAARLFRMLGLHPTGEFSVAAAAALVATGPRQARRLLDGLVAAHMVDQTAPDRYRFHDLLRAYAIDQARTEQEPQESELAVQRVLAWYLHAADAAQASIAPHEPRVPLEPLDPGVEPAAFNDEAAAMQWFEVESENLAAATRTATTMGLDKCAWQLAIVLRAFYMIRNPFHDWLATSQLGLEAARRDGDRHAQAELHESLGMAYAQSHRLDQAAEQYHAALTIRRELDDSVGEALTLNGFGLLQLRRHQLLGAQDALEKAHALFEDLDDTYWEPRTAVNVAEVQAALGRPAEAEHLVHAGLETFREKGDRWAEGNALRILSLIQTETGHESEALDTAQRAVDLALDLNSAVAEGHWLTQLGHAQRAAGRPADALVSYHRAAVLQRRLGDRSREALAWDGTGQAYLELGRAQEASDFHRRALAVHRELGDRWQHAAALCCLGEALDASDASADVEQYRREALTLLGDFTDPGALRLRERITNALGEGA
ncbi:tetratricopeptide (TPR) repeat protein [Kitasatospora sp. MAP12-15]|uniref:ATP-binding protein n=1 Tax=unclassified Kitasatospora TaxID=2633591 RepID=UPI002475337C|nr:tetratricopeptide repeat protein [Kitasatospora sp. MAP12-44]MDH6109238.1 tetratricopeptide (TPR) repeat protein [Kitasatospora sp. MAP12-44]